MEWMVFKRGEMPLQGIIVINAKLFKITIMD